MSQDENDLLNRRAQRLGALLRETDPPVPTMAFPAARIARAARRGPVVRWRVAAAIALLAVASVGVRPVRAWIVQVARVLWAATAGAPRTADVHRAPADAGPSTVTFTPAAGSFILRVQASQTGGTLTVEATSGATASAAIAGGGAELVVLPDGLRIVNDAASTASYTVHLPASLARIEVGVGRAATRVLVPTGPGTRWVLSLRATP